MNDRIICFDVETTGLDPKNDEILQLSIIDGNKNTLFNEYFKPERMKLWDQAQKVHGISPSIVSNKKSFKYYLKIIQGIFDNANIIIGYNVGFDIEFLEEHGINLDKEYEIFDVMLEFAEIYGEWSDYFENYKWQKLTTCATYYEYKFDAHDSLEDVKATLHCYYKILENEKNKELEMEGVIK